MRPEMVIAVKEFKDHLTSNRFLIIFVVLILMSIAAIVTGVGDYHDQIASYASYNYSLTQAASGSYGGFQPPMPSMMFVFQRFSVIYASIGWILAIAIGFDLISKEIGDRLS